MGKKQMLARIGLRVEIYILVELYVHKDTRQINSALSGKDRKIRSNSNFLLLILARMVALVQLLEPLARNVGIDLSGRNIGVTK